MTITDWIQAISMVVLAIITGIYAWRTHVMSKAAREQADASMTMAEQMRKQRYSESLPLLIPTVTKNWNTQGLKSNEIPYEYLQTGIGIKVVWRNVGKGTAINSRFSFWSAPTSSGKANFFPPSESGTLEVGGKKEVDYSELLDESQLRDIPQGYHPHLLAEYQDIYERRITTVQKFRIDEQNKRAFLGELYFTIDGKRLGEEVIRHD